MHNKGQECRAYIVQGEAKLTHRILKVPLFGGSTALQSGLRLTECRQLVPETVKLGLDCLVETGFNSMLHADVCT
jgi:hypothetical protein